jgi:hypothetical protein
MAFFREVVRINSGGLLRLELEHPGAVGDLVFEVELAVVGGVGLPHLPDDFQPALAEAAQRLGVGLATLAQGIVISVGPRALRAAFVGEEMHGVAQVEGARTAQAHLVDLAGLVADGSGAGHALETARILVQGAVAADLAQQPRPELGPGAGEGPEEVVIGMAGEELLDAAAVGGELGLEHAQLPAAGDGEEALGLDDGGR